MHATLFRFLLPKNTYTNVTSVFLQKWMKCEVATWANADKVRGVWIHFQGKTQKGRFFFFHALRNSKLLTVKGLMCFSQPESRNHVSRRLKLLVGSDLFCWSQRSGPDRRLSRPNTQLTEPVERHSASRQNKNNSGLRVREPVWC